MSAAPLGIRVRQTDDKHSLPGPLPAGERVLWRGAPDWRALARNALHLRGLSLYFGLLVGWVAVSAVWHGEAAEAVALDTGRAALAALVPLGLCVGYAWLAGRAAAYTITNKRVIMRMGLGVPITLNLPFVRIDGAGLSMKSDGTGDIALQMAAGSKGVSWFILWPHTRPIQFGATQPMLRALPDASVAAEVLARALADSAAAPGPATVSLAQATGIVDTMDCNAGTTVVAA